MAATDLFWRAPPAPAGALPQTPALLRDGATPDGEKGRGRGISSPGGHRCHRTPGQVKGAFGVAREGASAPLAPSGNRRHHRGLPDEEMPSSSGNRAAAGPQPRTSTHHHSEQMFGKNKKSKTERSSTGLGKARPGYRR
jgi:hypothetical protein